LNYTRVRAERPFEPNSIEFGAVGSSAAAMTPTTLNWRGPQLLPKHREPGKGTRAILPGHGQRIDHADPHAEAARA